MPMLPSSPASLGLRAGVVLAVISLMGFAGPARADEAGDLIERLHKAVDASSALAEKVGGYSAVSEQRWADGSSERLSSDYLLDNSVSRELITQVPGSPIKRAAYISDRQAKTFARLADSSLETRRALKLMKAEPDSWIVGQMPGIPLQPGPSNSPIFIAYVSPGDGLNYYLPSDGFAYTGVTEVAPGDIRYSLRGNEPGTIGTDLDLEVHLNSDGAVDQLTVSDVSQKTPRNRTTTFTYVKPVIEQPTGSGVVKRADFERAKQAPKLLDRIQSFAFRAGVGMASPSPAKLYEQARLDVDSFRSFKLWIPIKVSKIKWGARIAAVNPFTKERHMCDLVVDFPGSNGKPEIYCKSGREEWKPLSMCVQSGTVAGCIWSGRSAAGAARRAPGARL